MDIKRLYRAFLDNPLITTDSRQNVEGAIFFCLKGERFDGNEFAEEAASKGARYVITNRSDLSGAPFLKTSDPLKALQNLAAMYRQSFMVPVLAIAGSNGKTTTKELLSNLISKEFKTFSTKGNLNNHIGVPLTLLSAPKDAQFLIIEIGANHLNETAELCEICRPNYGIVTNNGKDHLGEFGGTENVERANAELYDYLRKSGGVAFVNGTDKDLIRWSLGVQRYLYNISNSLAYPAIKNSELIPSFEFQKFPQKVQLQLFGAHNIVNAVAAAAVGRYFGISWEKIISALESYRPVGYRSSLLEWKGARIIADCYNANPSSMEAALHSFIQTAPNPRLMVLADMLELGDFSESEHLSIIRQILNYPDIQVALLGPGFRHASKTLSAPLNNFESLDELKEWFQKQNWEGWHILLKGSRKFTLEKILE